MSPLTCPGRTASGAACPWLGVWSTGVLEYSWPHLCEMVSPGGQQRVASHLGPWGLLTQAALGPHSGCAPLRAAAFTGLWASVLPCARLFFLQLLSHLGGHSLSRSSPVGVRVWVLWFDYPGGKNGWGAPEEPRAMVWPGALTLTTSSMASPVLSGGWHL